MPKTTKQTLKTLGKKIQKLRKEKGLSQEEFAGQLHISRNYMGFIEQNRETPSLKLLIKIARRLNVKVEDLFHQ